MSTLDAPRTWPAETLARVPYWVYQDEDIYRAEQRRIFEGPVWNYLCLETDLAAAGDYRTTFVGEMPVVVVRAEDGEIYAFENRCAHRGALICLDDARHARRTSSASTTPGATTCAATSLGIAFEPRRERQGRHARRLRQDRARPAQAADRHALRPGVRHAVRRRAADRGLSRPRDRGRVAPRAAASPCEVIGRFTQALPNNWKLYFENVKDTYHASLLHLFFATFRITRLTQGGGVLVSETAAHHASYTLDRADDRRARPIATQGMRSEQGGLPPRRSEPARHGRRVRRRHPLQILSHLPGLRAAAGPQLRSRCARSCPRASDATDLNWTYLGFADDTPELRSRRLQQNNLVGPAGYVSMEDGASAASCSAASPRPATRCRWSRWAAPAPRRRRRARPRPRCAASGRRIARTWRW